MTKQNKQIVILCALVLIWAVSWLLMSSGRSTSALAVVAAKAAKAASQENALMARFHRIRAEIDGLYHYRIKPIPFDHAGDPFRIPQSMQSLENSKALTQNTKLSTAEPVPASSIATESGEVLLAHAVSGMRIGGVVTMNDTTQLTVDGQLHKEGDVFTTNVQGRLVLIRIRHLSTVSATLALDDPSAGTAEMRVRLK
jgi:hypothetical protein